MPLIQEALTAKILEASSEVSSELGIGFLESVYQNALVIALHEKGLYAESEFPIEVKFRRHIVGVFKADLIVNKAVLVELKSVAGLLPEHKAQVINYLKATGLEIGLLINFGKAKIEYNRLEHPKLRLELPKIKQSNP